jgi:signal transduction histidine kinase
MTNNLFLDWPILTISLFNAILLSWLGLVVLLSAERRQVWGIWISSTGLLMGGAFFISHIAILTLGLFTIGRSMILWWTGGLVPAIVLPFGWYVIILWYNGYWGNRPSSLFSRHRYWFWLIVAIMAAGLISIFMGIVLLSTSHTQFVQLRLFVRWSIAGIPLLALGYSIYVVLCIVLSLDALRRPGPSMRLMGTIARQRAHPWLAAVSVILLLVSLLVAAVMLWVVQDARQRTFWEIYQESSTLIAAFDLLISLLTAVAIVLLGQAIVSYEVFTGKTLPRRGLWRHWRRVIFLAVGYGTIVGGSLAINLRPLYSLLLTTFLMTFFAALFSWRSFVDRERYIDHLRPFVASQRLYDQLLTQSAPVEVDIATPFHVLCAEVLDAQVAFLAPLGPLAPLVGSPLVHGRRNNDLPTFTKLINIEPMDSRQTMALAIDPEEYGGAVWAVPLWSERGLIGLFLLGNKSGGGLYTQEEIEIARVSGERLIDTQASAEMARRLMGLQRQRLAQTQVIDQHTRRTLHDDILPSLQAAMITLSSSPSYDPQVAETLNMLTDAHRQISDLLHTMPTTTAPEVARLGLVDALQRVVKDDFGHAFDEIQWHIEPQVHTQISKISPVTAEVIFYAAREAVRNAAKYGRAADRPFQLCIQMVWQDGLIVSVEDSGVGLTAVSPNNGSGQGLAIHSTMMAVIGGTLTTDSVPGQFTRVSLTLPQGNWT